MEAEEEKLLEHAKNAVHALTDKKQKWTKKVGSFLLEILVIVIAVNITIWFHNWNDKKHERQLEKEFLIGVRENLIANTAIIKSNINYYKYQSLVYYDSVESQINSNQINARYVDSCFYQLINNTILNYDYSIFQSFSSAGNLRLVENKKLLSAIMNLYSTDLPASELNNKETTTMRIDGFIKYIGSKIGLNIGPNSFTAKLSTIIHQPEVKFQIQFGGIAIKSMNDQNEHLVVKIDTLIRDIDKELKEKFKYAP